MIGTQLGLGQLGYPLEQHMLKSGVPVADVRPGCGSQLLGIRDLVWNKYRFPANARVDTTSFGCFGGVINIFHTGVNDVWCSKDWGRTWIVNTLTGGTEHKIVTHNGRGWFVNPSHNNAGNIGHWSSDGLNWFSRTMPGTFYWYSNATLAGGRILAVPYSQSNAYYTNDEGASWTSTALGASSTWRGVAHLPGATFIYNEAGAGRLSTDNGLTWSAVTTPTIAPGTYPMYVNGTVFFHKATTFELLTTRDFLQWQTLSLPQGGFRLNGGLRNLHNGEYFFALPSTGDLTRAQVSVDGTTWYPSSQRLPVPAAATSVCFASRGRVYLWNTGSADVYVGTLPGVDP